MYIFIMYVYYEYLLLDIYIYIYIYISLIYSSFLEATPLNAMSYKLDFPKN